MDRRAGGRRSPTTRTERTASIDRCTTDVAALTVLAGLWIGAPLRRLLARKLPRADAEVSLALSAIVEATTRGDQIVLVSAAPELRGMTVLVTARASSFADEIELARRGAPPGYRTSSSLPVAAPGS